MSAVPKKPCLKGLKGNDTLDISLREKYNVPKGMLIAKYKDWKDLNILVDDYVSKSLTLVPAKDFFSLLTLNLSKIVEMKSDLRNLQLLSSCAQSIQSFIKNSSVKEELLGIYQRAELKRRAEIAGEETGILLSERGALIYQNEVREEIRDFRVGTKRSLRLRS
ncbi:hypothetical protein BDB01DRAFT_397195 [Pilobolus umbonatus]|nr:hypothetical protein BDB01DRAFT_397195 [Pilobolus umbonatus]